MAANGLLLELVFALCVAGALAGIVVPDRRNPALLAWAGSLAALLTLWVSGNVLWSGQIFQAELWTIPGWGTLTISLDRLSAFFLAVSALVVLASSIFSAGYLKRYVGHYSLRALNAWYLLLFASIVLVLIASNALLFLLAWELMTILSYLLVNFEHRREETCRAGYLMLVMSEAGFMAVILVFLFLGAKAGSLSFAALKASGASLGGLARWLIFLLTFFGFGVKAGLVPVNSWLPRAHPVAPGNISVILSGVIVNLGIYGIMRVNVDLLPVTSVIPGLIVLLVGAVSALIGVLYANIEHNLKTMLAHHTVEQMGIVTIGLGAGLVFAAAGRPVLATIAFIAAIYHMANHSFFKGLLFLSAASVDATAGARNIDRLGGLIKRMPWTAFFFLIGAISLVALPPFNGFVSEWLTLQTLLRSTELSFTGATGAKIVFVLCGAGLALATALAVNCFVKAFAMTFLGVGRSDDVNAAREAPRSMTWAMGLLAALCLGCGVLPTYVIPVLNNVITPLTGANAMDALVPPFFVSNPAHNTLPPAFAQDFHNLGAQVGQNVLPGRGLVVMHRGGAENPVVFAMSTSYMVVVLVGLLVITYVVLRLWLTRRQKLVRQQRWDGGVRRLLPEMTYTATGFSNPVRVIFDAVFCPTTVSDTRETVVQHFRTAIRRERQEVHVVDRWVLQPMWNAVTNLARRLAVMHHGRLNAYAAYVLLAAMLAVAIGVLGLLLWSN